MLATTFYAGQGLGNQMWAYAVTRSLAEAQGYTFGFLGVDRFKGPFFGLNFGEKIEVSAPKSPQAYLPTGFENYVVERSDRRADGADVSVLDPRLLTLPPKTLIDGNFQAENYFHDPGLVKSWFHLGRETRDVCVLNIRGGEYKALSDVFLPREYFLRSMSIVRDFLPGIQFEIVTDDLALARDWFPQIPAYSSGGVKRFIGGIYIHPSWQQVKSDFERVQTARAVIMSNSSFSWWGTFSNLQLELAIAPKYWARHNVSDGYWSTGDSLTRGWLYLDRRGQLFSYEQCKSELSR